MNLRPSGYEPDELPDCSTPHLRDADYRDRAEPYQPEPAFSPGNHPEAGATVLAGPGEHGGNGAEERT